MRKIVLIFLGMLIIGAGGYFLVPRDLWLFYVFAHVGAIGILGLLASVAGIIALRKNRNRNRAFKFGFLVSIIIGVFAVLVLFIIQNGRLYCGGSVCLGVSILIIGFYSFIHKISLPKLP
jgi:hypothetical protein